MVKPHVFYIDDDEDDRELFQMVVQDVEPTVSFTCLSSAIEALEIILKEERIPDLVIVDLNMPKLNGFDFLKAIRRANLVRKPTVVVLTTSALQSERSKCFELGAAEFICKGEGYQDFHKGVNDALLKHCFNRY